MNSRGKNPDKMTWTWLCRGHLNSDTEYLILVAICQKQMGPNQTDRIEQIRRCRLYYERYKTVNSIFSPVKFSKNTFLNC